LAPGFSHSVARSFHSPHGRACHDVSTADRGHNDRYKVILHFGLVLGIDAVSAGSLLNVENQRAGEHGQPRAVLTVVNYRGSRLCAHLIRCPGLRQFGVWPQALTRPARAKAPEHEIISHRAHPRPRRRLSSSNFFRPTTSFKFESEDEDESLNNSATGIYLWLNPSHNLLGRGA